MKKILYGLVTIFWFVCQVGYGADMMDVYCDAVKCDPTFNAQYAELLANKQNVPINRALLLPRLDIQAEAERERTRLTGISFANLNTATGIFIPVATTQTFYNKSIYYDLKLTQPVFNYTSWAKLQQAKAGVKQAEASFCAAAQDLMVRVVRAYFDVMIAHSDLFYTQQQKKAVAEQLRQSKEQFKVGVVPITDVYDALANYDLVAAQEITDRYTLATKLEAVRQITNHLYCDLKDLGGYLPLIVPQAPNINAWVCLTEKQNYELLSARFAALAARENIKVQAGGKYPVINSYGEYTYNYDSNTQGSGFYNRQGTLAGGVELIWSPIQGGGVTARSIQAEYQYQQASLEQERVHREVVSDARNAFLGIFSGIAQVRANRQAIISSQQSLKATMESYRIGTRISLDVLNQQTKLYNAEKIFSRSRYDYIYQTVLLKQAAGTLTVCDLQRINAWLYHPIDVSFYDALLDGCAMPSTH